MVYCSVAHFGEMLFIVVSTVPILSLCPQKIFFLHPHFLLFLSYSIIFSFHPVPFVYFNSLSIENAATFSDQFTTLSLLSTSLLFSRLYPVVHFFPLSSLLRSILSLSPVLPCHSVPCALPFSPMSSRLFSMCAFLACFFSSRL